MATQVRLPSLNTGHNWPHQPRGTHHRTPPLRHASSDADEPGAYPFFTAAAAASDATHSSLDTVSVSPDTTPPALPSPLLTSSPTPPAQRPPASSTAALTRVPTHRPCTCPLPTPRRRGTLPWKLSSRGVVEAISALLFRAHVSFVEWLMTWDPLEKVVSLRVLPSLSHTDSSSMTSTVLLHTGTGCQGLSPSSSHCPHLHPAVPIFIQLSPSLSSWTIHIVRSVWLVLPDLTDLCLILFLDSCMFSFHNRTFLPVLFSSTFYLHLDLRSSILILVTYPRFSSSGSH